MKVLGSFVAFVALLALSGCDISFPTQPSENSSVTVTVNQTVPAPGSVAPEATPTPTACPAVASVVVSGFGGPAPVSLAVGDTTRLDATPRDDQGETRDAACDLTSGVSWQISGPCGVDDASNFTPTLTALGTGTCEARAVVDGVGGSLTFTVTP